MIMFWAWAKVVGIFMAAGGLVWALFSGFRGIPLYLMIIGAVLVVLNHFYIKGKYIQMGVTPPWER